MSVRVSTAKEILGGKFVVMSAQPFHSGLKGNWVKAEKKAARKGSRCSSSAPRGAKDAFEPD